MCVDKREICIKKSAPSMSGRLIGKMVKCGHLEERWRCLFFCFKSVKILIISVDILDKSY